MKKLLMCLTLVSAPLLAADGVEDPCNMQGGGVMAGYLCVEQKLKAADAELNKTYQQAIIRIREEETALRKTWSETELVEPFRASQRAWLKFKDAECEFVGLSSTPSPWQGVQIEECKLEMILERIEYFKGVFWG
ncbi:hypothetical protein VISI1226_03410 [Vibrio sinaloensis DSM 21326]|uniref:Lysozyme inhibitor LprI-like N-terminal domain-containing protein n=1 Tax=Vibrio sinaloensis DSM 21326 TaxID=945550 RepID=E8MB73_PHOS4|nr:lysozyme inhibitor LprI family protein [Vibrio sinaloensis]EGA68656.1 hypothetical protein VISI1226_03410 [Vibrio sinaloensis DSM 21326]